MGKNLANCTPREFATQSLLIKRHVAKWLELTEIMKIRQKKPVIPEDATEEEKKELIRKQAMANFSEMFDSCMESHPDETVELLALLCFVPVSEVDEHPMSYYMKSLSEIIADNTVWDFFISLAVAARRLGITQG